MPVEGDVMKRTPKEFAIGDQVRIGRRSHPACGQVGTIVRAFSYADLKWVVRLRRDDALDGHECAAADADLRHAAGGGTA